MFKLIGILAYSYSDVATIMENATIVNVKEVGNITYYKISINKANYIDIGTYTLSSDMSFKEIADIITID